MRLVSCRLPPARFDHELIWLVVSIATAGGGAVWLNLGLSWPRCPFLAITGFPCLTCGATRCAVNLLHGNFLQAFWWNPLAMLALLGVVLFDLYAAVVVLCRSARLRLVDWTVTEKNAVRIAAVVVIALNWIYLLAHRAQF